ncbi:MAG: phospholipase A1 [Pseudohongiellaceae bacterium]
MEHQSNGQSSLLSRNWSRVYVSNSFEKENPNKSKGDDNPDIEKFMGHFELRSAYRWNNHELSLMTRNNLRSDNKRAFELG